MEMRLNYLDLIPSPINLERVDVDSIEPVGN